VEPEVVSEDTELPLPDEELPRWAQKSMRELRKEAVVIAAESEDVDEPNEWEELSDATDILRDSLPRDPGRDDADAEDEDQAEEEAQRLREELAEKLGQDLFDMLLQNLEQDDLESAREFLEIMQEEDPEALRDARRLLELERDE
jgi:hypothetical protein